MSQGPGFSPKTLKFLKDLRANNNKQWFTDNRAAAEEYLFAPARDLVTLVGELLRHKRPDIIADPRTDRSIYRLHRDTRFRHDKTPYKTHLALWWWEGGEGRLECPGFYLHLEPEFLGWSVGCYRFSPEGLAKWRAMLLDPAKAAVLNRQAKKLAAKGFDFCAPELKRAPAGYAADHPQAEWLRRKGLYTWNQQAPYPGELFADDAAEFVYNHFKPALDFHALMVETLSA